VGDCAQYWLPAVRRPFTSVFASFADISPEEFRRVTEVGYPGSVHGTMVRGRR
jgi:hypothetical protein